MACVDDLRLDAWVFSKTPRDLADVFVKAIGMPEVAPRRPIALEWGHALALSFVPQQDIVFDAPPDPNDIGWMAMTARVSETMSGLADAFPKDMVWTVLRRRSSRDCPRPIFFFNVLLPEEVSASFGRQSRASSMVFLPPAHLAHQSWDDVWSEAATVEALFLQHERREWWPSVVAHQRAHALGERLPESADATLKERL